MPSFLDSPKGSVLLFLEMEIGSMIFAKEHMARFTAAVYASPSCAMFGMEPSPALFAYSAVLLQLQQDF